MTTIAAVIKSFFLGNAAESGRRKTREKQIAPRSPPYAMINWSFIVSVIVRNWLIIRVRKNTPKKKKKKTFRHAV